MKQLKVFNLSDNHIHSLPDDWGYLDLIALDISRNVLSEVNLSIKCQSSLEVLVMNNCNLKNFPYHVLELTNLRCLYLDNNPLGKLDVDALLQPANLQSISLTSCLIPEFCGTWFSDVQDISLGFNSIQLFPVDLSRHLTFLKLYGNQLDTIPEELSLLENLTELDVSYCKLSEFPLPVLKMRKLDDLDISNNFIHTIPEDITKLPLRIFYFGGNPIDEFPIFFDQFSDLVQTDMSRCFLDKIPPTIYGLKHLREIKLSENCITELHEQVCQLDLEKLHMADNPLNQLPESFRNLTNLKHLDISSTNMKEIPFQILNIASIEYLAVRNNAIEKLPEVWEKCINIKKFDMSENSLRTLPASILQLQKIEELDLRSCCLSEFRNVLLQLRSLQVLNLEENFISELPDNFQSLNVRTLNLRINLLNHLPDSLSAQRRLVNLDISSNRLTKFPSVIFKLHSIKHVALCDNFISVLPEKWEGLHVVKLSLDRNPLVNIGNSPLHELKYIVNLSLKNCLLNKIRTYFSSFSFMSSLDISGNNITASASSAIPPNLTRLVLNNNPLTTVPESVEQAMKLNELSLQSCGLTKIPTFICFLKGLEHLDISYNSLTYLPSGMENTMLTLLSLSSNPLKSLDSLNSLTRLRQLYASACQLHMFPRVVLRLHKLIELDLCYNTFTSIPSDIQHDNLRILSLRSNSTISLPIAIASLKNLHTLEVGKLQEFPESVLRMSHLSTLKMKVDNSNLLMLPTSWGEELRNLRILHCSSALNLVSVSFLSKLTNFDIFDSKETIPVAAFQSQFLRHLDISPNSLYREHTLSTIQSLLLESLDIWGYKLQYLPNIFVEFSRLRKLRISNSRLKDFPDELSKMLKKT